MPKPSQQRSARPATGSIPSQDSGSTSASLPPTSLVSTSPVSRSKPLAPRRGPSGEQAVARARARARAMRRISLSPSHALEPDVPGAPDVDVSKRFMSLLQRSAKTFEGQRSSIRRKCCNLAGLAHRRSRYHSHDPVDADAADVVLKRSRTPSRKDEPGRIYGELTPAASSLQSQKSHRARLAAASPSSLPGKRRSAERR